MEEKTPVAAAPSGALQTASAGPDVPVDDCSTIRPPITPLPLGEADSSRRQHKTREFRKYLVDTKVVEALVKILLPLYNCEDKPIDPQDLFVKYFGRYRDPLEDEIEDLRRRREELIRANQDLAETELSLSSKILSAATRRRHLQLWHAIARDSESTTSMQIYQRLCDRKKPKSSMKCHTFSKDQFLRFVAASTTKEWQAQLWSALYPEGRGGEYLTTPPFKTDVDNPVVLSFIEANNNCDLEIFETT